MNGTHRKHGILIATNIDTIERRDGGFALVDVAPTVLAALGLDPVEATPGGAGPSQPPRQYSEAEDELVAARLRAMGYLE